jgi:hypothetical protein
MVVSSSINTLVLRSRCHHDSPSVLVACVVTGLIRLAFAMQTTIRKQITFVPTVWFLELLSWREIQLALITIADELTGTTKMEFPNGLNNREETSLLPS